MIQPSVTIDASMLAVPTVNCTTEEVYKFVESILDWKYSLSESCVAIYMSERASTALVNDGLFPMREHLHNLFRNHGVVEFSVQDVAMITDQLLTITPSFEQNFSIKDVLFYSEHFETKPDIVQSITHRNLRSELSRCIALTAILYRCALQSILNHFLILRNVSKQEVQVKIQIEDLDHSRDDILDIPIPPNYFESSVFVCKSLSEVVESIDESKMLIHATNDFEIRFAIRIAIFKDYIAEGDVREWGDILNPKIGIEFRELCQKCCHDQADSLPSKILRSIVETIKNKNLRDVHALRDGAGPENPQRVRNNDKAQRRKIDDQFRLHYWECSDNTKELASVVYHNDFSIPK